MKMIGIKKLLGEYEMATDIKSISVKEFRALGFLQEANRCFFHPLGLALSIQINEDGSEEFGAIWDYREDPEGITYGKDMISKDKADAVTALHDSKLAARVNNLGFIIQPTE